MNFTFEELLALNIGNLVIQNIKYDAEIVRLKEEMKKMSEAIVEKEITATKAE